MIMQPLPDYHLHTSATEDGCNTLTEIAEAAAARGLREIAITDHYILVDDKYMVTREVLERHKAEAREAGERLGIKILIGAEVDYLPGYAPEIKSYLNSYEFDFIIGAAHFVDGLPIANEPTARKFLKDNGPRAAFRKSLEAAERAAESRLFDVIAHPDIIRKFHDDPSAPLTFDEYAEAAERLARVMRDAGTGFEVNCRGFSHAAGSQYPSGEFLRVLKKCGVGTVTIGSDAHQTQFVGADLDRGFAALRAAGFTHLTLFEKRKPRRVPVEEFEY